MITVTAQAPHPIQSASQVLESSTLKVICDARLKVISDALGIGHIYERVWGGGANPHCPGGARHQPAAARQSPFLYQRA